MSPPIFLTIKTLAISTSLLSAGGIFCLSLFDVPLLQAQPASRSLPSIRWLFSRGSHIFPAAAGLSASGFVYLALASLPAGRSVTSILLGVGGNGLKTNGFVLAALLNLGVGLWTIAMMLPTNFSLIERNERLGGRRRAKSAASGAKAGRSAEDSVAGKGDVDEFNDLSRPQEKTERESTKAENEVVRELLGNFGRLNAVRAAFAAAGGGVGLVAALA